MAENNGSGMNSVMAFLLGGAIGAAIALLYAPSSGQETRERVRNGVDRVKGRVKDGYDTAIHEAEHQIDTVKTFVHNKQDEVKAAIDAGKQAYHSEKERHHAS